MTAHRQTIELHGAYFNFQVPNLKFKFQVNFVVKYLYLVKYSLLKVNLNHWLS